MPSNTNELDSLRAEIAHLRQEVTMYQYIFAQSPIGTYVYHLEDRDDDRTLRMIAANPIVEQLAGLPPQDIVGKTLDENFPGLRDQGIPQAFAQVVRTGEPLETESLYVASTFMVRAVALPNDCVAVMFENITARRQAEQALRLANEELEQRVADRTAQLHYHQSLLQHVLNTSPAAIYVKDLDGQFLLVNQRTSSLLGLTPDEMQGKLDTELFPADFADQWRSNEQRVIDANEPISIEETVIQEDGLHTFLSTRSPIYDETGKLYAIGGISYDITERKRQEEELRMFKAVFDNASDAISIVRPDDGTILYYNDAHRTLYRCGDSHLGQPISVIVAPQDQEHLPGILDEIKGKGIWKGQLLHIRHDGTTFPVLESCFVTRDTAGNVNAMVGIVRDITDIQQAENERATLQQQVIDAQRSALRELSTPLIPISDDVMIMPLIGTIDSQRAQMVMEALLEGVAQHQARLVILDITGVSVVDTQVAQAFIQAAQAVKLLGAQVMLTGIQPQIAQTLVMLGTDLSGIETRGSLQAGITAALQG